MYIVFAVGLPLCLISNYCNFLCCWLFTLRDKALLSPDLDPIVPCLMKPMEPVY